MKRRFFRNPTLRKKIIITSIACLMMPTLLMVYNTDYFSKRVIREHTLGSSAQTLKNVQVQIDKLIEEMVSVSNMIQFDPELLNLLNESDNPLAIKSVTTKLEQLSNNKPSMQITLLTIGGRSYTNYSYYDFDPQIFQSESWFPELAGLKAFDTLFIGVQPAKLISGASGSYNIMTARALRSYSQKPLAYLIVSYSENTVRSLFENYSQSLFLLDEHGKIMSSKDQSLIETSFNDLTPKGSGESPEIIPLHGENLVYASLPLRYAGWKLVSLAPYEKLTDRLNGIYQAGLLLQLLFMTGFTLILVYLLRKFTSPIQKLGKAAVLVEEGNLEVRSNVRGRDEVGQLGKAFDHMLDRIVDTLEQVRTEQELKRFAEIEMLHAQIHPHFLFNVLSSIRLKLLLNNDEQNAQLVGSLSSLLRLSFSNQQEFVSLIGELEVTREYVDLMNFTVRYPAMYIEDVPPELFMENVPRFILQPLIENAYKHGFIRKSGSIAVSAERMERHLIITVKDNGKGVEKAVQDQLNLHFKQTKGQIIERSQGNMPGRGIGLMNVYNRLKLIYGSSFDMVITSRPDQGTTVSLLLPVSDN